MPTLEEERQLPRSIIHHRPIAPDVISPQVQTPRASWHRQKHEPHTTGGPPSLASIRRTRAVRTALISSFAGDALCVLPHPGGGTAYQLGQYHP